MEEPIMTPASTVASLLLLLMPVTLPVQEETPLRAGSRVQVHLADPKPRLVRGSLVGAEADSVRLLSENGRDTLAFSTAELSQIDTTAGRRARTGKGALLGAGIGAGAGLALAVAATIEGCSGFCTDPSVGEIAAVSLIFAGVGAGVGALIGSATHTDRWVPVSRSPVTIGVAPTVGRRGIGLMLTMRTRRAYTSRRHVTGAE
jgi:hypothetical protein